MKLLVSAPPPTANGDLHVGHLSGPFLRADILHRYSRMRGREVHCINGADEHQSYVAFRAAQLGLTPQQAVDKFSEAIFKTLQAAHLHYDVYLRPSRSSEHQKLVQEVFAQLYARGKLITRESQELYCENCERFLFEVYVRGQCPHCGAPSCGNACEACGRPNRCTDLKDPACNQCGATPTARSSTRLYFPLAAYEDKLRSYYETVVMNPRLRGICEGMLKDGLPEIVMCLPADWGIPVPVPGFEGQRIYVWFEVAAGLLSASQQLSQKLGLSEGWKDFWRDDDVEVVQFCGFDNGYFYGMLIPALLLAYDPEIKLPTAILINEFYRLDGSKFSTSRNHAIWGRELLEQASVDTVRFYLALNGPETEQTNFTIAEFKETVRRELGGVWQGWLQDLGMRCANDYGGVAPSIDVWTDELRQFHDDLKRFIAAAGAAYEPADYSPRRAAGILMELVNAANSLGEGSRREESSSSQRGRLQTRTALELAAANTLSMLAAPIMPEFSAQLWTNLGNAGSVAEGSWCEEPKWVPPGTRLDNVGQLYFSVAGPPRRSRAVHLATSN
jgi:methionyl-tRNA synthetase